MVRIPTHRAPTHPGEMLLEEFLKPMGLTQRELADAIHVPYQRINEVINGRRGITPSTALRLSKFFDVSADFWMNLQLNNERVSFLENIFYNFFLKRPEFIVSEYIPKNSLCSVYHSPLFVFLTILESFPHMDRSINGRPEIRNRAGF